MFGIKEKARSKTEAFKLLIFSLYRRNLPGLKFFRIFRELSRF